MQLLELTSAEIAFLAPPPASSDSLEGRLTRRLAMTLSARLRLPVELAARAVDAPADAPVSPRWQADAALATLWLTRRLGGQRVVGASTFVPATLIHTLDAALAESWLDAKSPVMPPSAMAWQITAAATRATLGVQFPHQTLDMTRWAREVIRHA
jgi:hypothetical protein